MCTDVRVHGTFRCLAPLRETARTKRKQLECGGSGDVRRIEGEQGRVLHEIGLGCCVVHDVLVGHVAEGPLGIRVEVGEHGLEHCLIVCIFPVYAEFVAYISACRCSEVASSIDRDSSASPGKILVLFTVFLNVEDNDAFVSCITLICHIAAELKFFKICV